MPRRKQDMPDKSMCFPMDSRGGGGEEGLSVGAGALREE